MPNVYAYRSGRSIKNVNPNAVGETLERIRQQEGELTADKVVEEAADKDSPLHPAFEWDNTVAAHQHRIAQARRLIVSIHIVNSPAAKPTLAFVSVRTPDRGRSYLPTLEALSDDDLKARVLMEARQAIEAIERRYHAFKEVADLLARLKQQVG